MHRTTVEEGLILLALTGSQAYGTAIATSDCDYKGVFIAPKDYYLGFKSIEQKDSGWATESGTGNFPILDGVKDCVVYELRKFLTLVGNNNPNIMETLWLDDEFYCHISPVGAHLISYRESFLSEKIRSSFVGYAYAQIKRVENHRRWLLNPPARKPLPQDFGLDENDYKPLPQDFGLDENDYKPLPQDFGLDENDYKPLTKGEMNAFLEFLYMLVRDCIEFLEPSQELYELLTAKIDFKAILRQHPLPETVLPKVQEYTRAKNDFIRLLHVSQTYRTALNEWEAYCRWQQGRNPQRKALEAKCGFDSKHMAHCIRLLRMGIEGLKNGVLRVNRKKAGDADYLLSIRQGDVPYEEVKEAAENLFQEIQGVSTTLPKQVDREFLNSVCVELVERAS